MIADKPVFRNRDKFPLDPRREWLRLRMPRPKDGFVVEDVDLVIRWHGDGGYYKTDSTGKFMLLELKFGFADMGFAQKTTFGLMDEILKKGDPRGERYQGYYLLQYTNEDWDESAFRINGQDVTRRQFRLFLHGLWKPEKQYAFNRKAQLFE